MVRSCLIASNEDAPLQLALAIETKTLVVAIFLRRGGCLERIATNRLARDWLGWLGTPLGDALERAANGLPVSDTTLGCLALGGVNLRSVTWTPTTAEARQPMAAARWRLTGRQGTVAALMGEGHANKSIATILGITEATVEVHVTRILEKAGVENRAAFVAAFWRETSTP